MDNHHFSTISSDNQPDPGFGILALMLYLFFLVLVLVLSGCAASRDTVSGKDGADALTRPTNCKSEQPGIPTEGLQLSAACNILDLHYRVDDSARAAPLQNHHLGQVMQSRITNI